MPKQGHYIHKAEVSSETSIGASFTTAVPIELHKDSTFLKDEGRFAGHLSAIYIQLDEVATSKEITLTLTSDSAGNDIIVPEETATIALAIADQTKGAVVYALGIDAKLLSSKVYAWCKTDADTCEISKISITWHE